MAKQTGPPGTPQSRYPIEIAMAMASLRKKLGVPYRQPPQSWWRTGRQGPGGKPTS